MLKRPSFYSGISKIAAGAIACLSNQHELGVALIASGIASLFGYDSKKSY